MTHRHRLTELFALVALVAIAWGGCVRVYGDEPVEAEATETGATSNPQRDELRVVIPAAIVGALAHAAFWMFFRWIFHPGDEQTAAYCRHADRLIAETQLTLDRTRRLGYRSTNSDNADRLVRDLHATLDNWNPPPPDPDTYRS